MEAEKIIEMFPSKSEQRIAQRVIENLRVYPDSNAMQISTAISPNKSESTRAADCNGLYHILDGLRALGAITYTSDYFNLNSENKASVILVYGSKKSNAQGSPVKKQARYVVFECENCGAAIGTRSSQMSVTCKTCNRRNKIDDEHKVLLKTNGFLEMQVAIQQDKKQKAASTDYFQKLTLY
jgi:hypothetical protein